MVDAAAVAMAGRQIYQHLENMPVDAPSPSENFTVNGASSEAAVQQGGRQKTCDVYAPDRPLPADEHGVPIPDTEAPHTQLGTRNGSKGKYPKAREFDAQGKPVRDIEFTDHGRPQDHPNPHQHRREDNPTGGTKSKEDPEPLPERRYE